MVRVEVPFNAFASKRDNKKYKINLKIIAKVKTKISITFVEGISFQSFIVLGKKLKR